MKRIVGWLVGLVAMLVSGLAFADATANTVTGTVSAATGSAAQRVVRQGDTLRAGDVVATGPNSSAVLRFDDGQIAVLGANSRMMIQAFEYNAPAKTGNIVLNLLQGGMRAITGLIGKANPTKVTYKAGNYTIGIRGTDVNIATDQGNVAVTVNEGSIVFTIAGQTFTVTANNGAFIRPDGSVRTGVIADIVNFVAPIAPILGDILRDVGSIPVIGVSFTPRSGEGPEVVTGTLTSTPAGPPTTGGGGTASNR